MKSIEFLAAKRQLEAYLDKHLRGEKQNGALERRAQRLADKWWINQKLVVIMGTSGIRVTGCRLGFDIGTVKVKSWRTAFTHDDNNVRIFSPSAIALGYCNGFQLYLIVLSNQPTLIARSREITRRWSTAEQFVPPPESPLFVALERAKALGYLPHLQGVENEA